MPPLPTHPFDGPQSGQTRAALSAEDPRSDSWRPDRIVRRRIGSRSQPQPSRRSTYQSAGRPVVGPRGPRDPVGRSISGSCFRPRRHWAPCNCCTSVLPFHVDVGLVFVALLCVHLFQRRRTLARMATRLVRSQKLIRLALADLLLPVPFDRWHLDSGLALVGYLVVHAWRRKKSFWRSTIR
jgi:hypothetical protein